MLAQEAVPDKANELAAIPLLLERLGADEGLKGALVSIDAIATNADIAKAITGQGADYLRVPWRGVAGEGQRELRHGRVDQSAMAGRLMMGSSLIGAMVSRVM